MSTDKGAGTKAGEGESGVVGGGVRQESETLTDKRESGTKRKVGGGRAGESGPIDGQEREDLDATPVTKKRKKSEVSLVVGYAPHMPQRYGHLLRLITFLLPYKNQGKAHECSLNRVGTLMTRKRCDLCLFFFEWVRKDKKMFCWIFNTLTRTCAQFLVNPAFASQMFDVKVKRATCVFSTNFCTDGKWAAVKQTLEMMFCPPEHETTEALGNLYIFTRTNDDCIYFRNIEIKEFPDISRGKVLFLKEIGPYFCLKLVDIQGETAVPYPASNVPQHQIKICPIEYSSLSPQLGCSMVAHSLCLKNEDYVILLEDSQNLSEFEGYSINLQELLEEQSFLKRKYIVGSKIGEQHMFARNVGKAIIRSIFAYFIKLFSSQKCLKMNIGHTNILLKESKVKFYGVEFVEYEKNLAIENVQLAVELVRGCFPLDSIPCDLEDMLDLLLEDPLQNLQAAEDDCSLKSAKERRELLVLLHTEYMTNVKPKLCGEGDDQQNCNDFFKGCPYLYNWEETMLRNTYLTAVANYNKLLGDKKLEKRKEEEREKKEEEKREKEKGDKKLEKRKEEESEKKEEEKRRENEEDVGRIDDGKLGEKGELQLCVMRNCDVHIPENAVKDGITPFRLTWSDYIRTFYFPKYLAFVHKRMLKYLKSKSDEGNEADDVTCREDEAGKIIAEVTSGKLSNDQ